MPAPTKEERLRWEEQGYLVVRGALDDALVGSMVDAIERIMDRAQRGEFGDSFRWIDRENRVPDFVNDLLTPCKYDPAFGALFDSVVLPYTEGLLGRPIRCSWLLMLSSGAGNAYGVALHRDNCALGVPEENELIERFRGKQAYFQAPLLPGDRFLQLVPGSHLRPATDLEISAAQPAGDAGDPPGLVTIELEPGDIVYRHTNTLHRGHNPDGVMRRTLVSSMWAASMPLLDIERQDHAGLCDPDFVQGLPDRCRRSVERYLEAYEDASRGRDEAGPER